MGYHHLYPGEDHGAIFPLPGREYLTCLKNIEEHVTNFYRHLRINAKSCESSEIFLLSAKNMVVGRGICDEPVTRRKNVLRRLTTNSWTMPIPT